MPGLPLSLAGNHKSTSGPLWSPMGFPSCLAAQNGKDPLIDHKGGSPNSCPFR